MVLYKRFGHIFKSKNTSYERLYERKILLQVRMQIIIASSGDTSDDSHIARVNA